MGRVRLLVFAVLLIAVAGTAEAQGIVVDHTSLAQFDQIPEQYLTAAANLTMMFVDESTGQNIDDGLLCLGYASDEAAPSRCKRFIHIVPQFSSTASDVNWSRPGGYNRTNWIYYTWPGSGVSPELPCGVDTGSWDRKLECFIRYVDANPTRYNVFSYQTSYLQVAGLNDIASPTTGYFVSQANRYDITEFEALEARHPGRIFVHHTANLGRGFGTQAALDFNHRMREYARTNNKILFDMADIESHDLSGNPCYDNRDGVAYTAGNASENHPDDGLNLPAICPQYTRESEGGHLGNPDVGKIRVAKAVWILMARIAGWNPGVVPGNTAPVANPQDITTAEDTLAVVTLTGSDADGDPLTFRVVGSPSHGALSGMTPNLGYTPAANFNGADGLTFVVNDGQVDSALATVALIVTPVNDDPVAQNDTAATAVDTATVVEVLSNDVDVDGDPLTITMVGNPSSGSVTSNGSNITYTPNLGFTGADSFTYTISDGYEIASAEVTVTVAPPGEDAGHALRFDGSSDFVTLGLTSSMMAPGWETTKTVELWIKPTGSSFCGSPFPGQCDAVFGDRPRSWGISRGVINGLDRIWVWNWDTTFRMIGIDYASGEWVHIAIVHGGGTLSAYRNGVLVGSIASGATRPGGAPALQLGGIINSATRNWTFEGEIDEVRIWNTARSAAEINQDMNRELDGAEYGLAAYYRMSDGSGTSLTDDSGHGWIGELRDGGQGVPADGPISWVPSGAFGEP